MSNINRQLRLQNRPKGLLAPGDLQLVEEPVAPLSDGQALARVKYLSIDPTMRVWMAVDTYLPAVAIGEVMRAGGFAEIIESRHPNYKKGDRVTGLTGFQEYVIIDASAKNFFQKVPKIPFVSDTIFLGVLGMNGLTAFFGMEIAPPAQPAASSVKLEKFTAAALSASPAPMINAPGSPRISVSTPPSTTNIRTGRKNSLQPLPMASTSILKMLAGKSCKKS